MYLFPELMPGDYYLVVPNPPGYSPSPADQGSDDGVDSDADVSGMTQIVSLSPGETDITIWAGFNQKAALGDYVWEDINGNGIQDQNEPGVAGIVVSLYSADNTLVETTSTDANGYYDFTGLEVGTYYLVFSSPQGYTFTTAGQGSDTAKDSNAGPDGRTGAVTLTSGKSDPTIDAGVNRPAMLGDYVWDDQNADGINQGRGAGIPGVLVELNKPDGSLAASTTTDAGGHYLFTGLFRVNIICFSMLLTDTASAQRIRERQTIRTAMWQPTAERIPSPCPLAQMIGAGMQPSIKKQLWATMSGRISMPTACRKARAGH